MTAGRVAIQLLLAVGVLPAHLSAATDASASNAASANELNTQGVTAAQGGQFERGAAYLRQAVQANPNDPLVQKNLSGVLTDWAALLDRSGQPAAAEPLLREAVEHDPENTTAWLRLGDLAYFVHSDFANAVRYWKQAYGKLPTAERRNVADRIAQAQRDQTIERDFASFQSPHFDIRAQQQERAALTDLGVLLEQGYRQLHDLLQDGPPKVTVIVYTAQDLHRTYNQRDWALGFYDGRLRLLGSELGTESARVLVAHELAHAFLQHAYGPGVPIWVHEGFAQMQELDRPRYAEELRLEQGIRAGTLWIPLKWLDRRFVQPSSTDDVGRAYVEARLVVEDLVKRHGIDQFKTFLAALGHGTAVDAAYDAVFAPDRWAGTDRNMVK